MFEETFLGLKDSRSFGLQIACLACRPGRKLTLILMELLILIFFNEKTKLFLIRIHH